MKHFKFINKKNLTISMFIDENNIEIIHPSGKFFIKKDELVDMSNSFTLEGYGYNDTKIFKFKFLRIGFFKEFISRELWLCFIAIEREHLYYVENLKERKKLQQFFITNYDK